MMNGGSAHDIAAKIQEMGTWQIKDSDPQFVRHTQSRSHLMKKDFLVVSGGWMGSPWCAVSSNNWRTVISADLLGKADEILIKADVRTTLSQVFSNDGAMTAKLPTLFQTHNCKTSERHYSSACFDSLHKHIASLSTAKAHTAVEAALVYEWDSTGSLILGRRRRG
jgi:hypothetical protein